MQSTMMFHWHKDNLSLSFFFSFRVFHTRGGHRLLCQLYYKPCPVPVPRPHYFGRPKRSNASPKWIDREELGKRRKGTEPEKTADNTRRHSWIPRENTSEERLQISVQGRVAVQFLRLTETGNRAWKASGTQGRLFKAGLNYPGLVRNLILDMKAWEADSVLFFLPTIWWLVALKKREKIIPENAFGKRKRNPS